jgi:hypothetical protein
MEAVADDDLERVAPPVDDAAAGDVSIPDFRGLTMDLARKMASEEKLKLRLVGSGRAQHQDHQVHARVPAGTMVTLVFEPSAPHMAASIPQAVGGPAPPAPTPSDGMKGATP